MKVHFFRYLLTVVGLGLIAACGEGPQPSRDLFLHVPPTISPEDLETVQAAMPKIQRACPGLIKYAADIGKSQTSAGAVEDYSGLGRHYMLTFQVADTPQYIPGRYRASGHTCYLYVDTPGAKSLLIAKSPCVSVCLDRSDAGGDVQLDLR